MTSLPQMTHTSCQSTIEVNRLLQSITQQPTTTTPLHRHLWIPLIFGNCHLMTMHKSPPLE